MKTWRIGWGGALAVVATALAAHAQPIGVAVVCEGAICDTEPYNEFASAGTIQEALEMPNVTTVFVTPGTWDAPAKQIADGVTIIGVEGQPFDIQIDGGGSAVLEVAGTGVYLEGLMLTGGTTGVLLQADARATINRCYITGNSVNGVSCAANAAADIVNCSIANNAGTGIHVASSTATTEVLNCSIIRNGPPDLSVATGGKIWFWNTLICPDGVSIGEFYDINTPSTVSFGYCNVYWLDLLPSDQPVFGFPPSVAASEVLTQFNPLLASGAEWVGKLDPIDNPLIDKGQTPEAGHSSAAHIGVDFEGEDRIAVDTAPNRVSRYDIGADEVIGGSTSADWLWCSVSPDPTPALLPGELHILLRTSTNVDREDIDDAYIMTSGATTRGQALDLNIWELGAGYFYATNAEHIDTRYYYPDGGGNYVVNDGDAVVTLNINGVTPDPPEGAYFLIDTVAPRLVVVRAVDCVANTNDAYRGDSVIAGRGYPPFDGRSAVHPYPFSDGWVGTFGGDEGGQVFFNVASISNELDAEPLMLTIVATFEDLPPEEAPERSVSGFDLTLATTFSGTVDDVLINPADLPGMPYWQVEEGYPGRLQPGHPVQATFSIAGNTLDAFWDLGALDPGLAADGGFHVALRFVGAEDRAGNGISPVATPTDLPDPLHIWWLMDTRSQLLPNPQSAGAGTAVQHLVVKPEFRATLDREFSPSLAAPLAPYFAFRLMASAPGTGEPPYMPVTDVLGFDGNGWSAWLADPALINQAFYASGGILDLYNGRTLLLVVVSIDEAGNVEKWPPEIVRNNQGNVTEINAAWGPNWRLFPIGRPLDTTISAVFWNDIRRNGIFNGWLDVVADPMEVSLGSAKVLCMPLVVNVSGEKEPHPTEALGARFHVGVAASPGMNMADAEVVWTLEKRLVDGSILNWDPANAIWTPSTPGQPKPFGVVGKDEVVQGWGVLPITEMYPDLLLGDWRDLDFPENLPITYVFRAATRLEETSNAADYTPAEYRFTVRDCTVEDQQTTVSDQPVKVFERE